MATLKEVLDKRASYIVREATMSNKPHYVSFTWEEWAKAYPAREVKDPPASTAGPFTDYVEALKECDNREIIDETAYEVVKYQNEYFVSPIL
jgi:hypothetical protein